MARDLYEVLGVARDADEDTIKKAFRKLAMKFHPDKNPGKANEQRFKEINQANDVLSDKEKRGLYDEFGEDSLSQNFDVERARMVKQYGSSGRGGPRQGPFNVQDIFRGGGGGANGAPDFDDLMGDLFGRARQQGGARGGMRPMAGQDFESTVTIDFASAVRGTTLSLQRGTETVSVRIPAGADEGSRLRIQGQGQPGIAGGPPGDLLLTIHVSPHLLFRREGDDLFLDVPLTIGEAFKGHRVRVPTPEGDVTLKVPALTQSGQISRLRGKGIARKGKEPGDLYVKFVVVYPTADDPEIVRAIETLERKMTDPRTNLKF